MHQSGDTVAKLRPPPIKGETDKESDDDTARGEVAVDALLGISGASPSPARAQGPDLYFVVIADPYSGVVLGWVMERRVGDQLATHRQPASHPS